jgi:hypothetical protein
MTQAQDRKYKYEWMEDFFKFLGFRLIHDGGQNLSPHELPERRFFTRKFQLWMNGKPVEAYVKFIYDRRRGECTDFKVYGRDSEGVKREQKMRMG